MGIWSGHPHLGCKNYLTLKRRSFSHGAPQGSQVPLFTLTLQEAPRFPLCPRGKAGLALDNGQTEGQLQQLSSGCIFHAFRTVGEF